MYSDINGYAPKVIETLAFSFNTVISVTAVVIGVGAVVGLTTLVSPAIGLALAFVGVSNLMKTAVVAKAQHQKSKGDGDSPEDTYSDVINATGNFALRKTLIPIGGVGFMKHLKDASIEMYNIVGDIQFSGHGQKFNPIVSKVGNTVGSINAGWVTGQTFVSFTDNVYCYDYAKKLGWKPE